MAEPSSPARSTADGAVRYEGEFADNLYSGAGKLYDGRGALIYDGTFRAGLYDGEGKLYGESGLLLYEGAFVKGENAYSLFSNRKG